MTDRASMETIADCRIVPVIAIESPDVALPLADAFLSLKGTGALEHIVGHSDDGIPLQTCVMCGPTLTLTAMHGPGDLIHCRSCGGEYRLIDDTAGSIGVVPTGRTGTASQLAPVADISLIARTVRDAAARAAFGRLLDQPPTI